MSARAWQRRRAKRTARELAADGWTPTGYGFTRSFHPSMTISWEPGQAYEQVRLAMRRLIAQLPPAPPLVRISDVDLALDMQRDAGPTREQWAALQRRLTHDERRGSGG